MQLEVTLIVNVISTDPFRGLFALKRLNKFEGRKAKRGRGREETQTERQTERDRERHRGTERERDRQTDKTDRHRGRQTERDRDRQIEFQVFIKRYELRFDLQSSSLRRVMFSGKW